MRGVPNQAAIDADFAERLLLETAIRGGLKRLPIALPAWLHTTAIAIGGSADSDAHALILFAEALEEIPSQIPAWRERYPVSRYPELANELLLQIGDCAVHAANHLRQLAPLYVTGADEANETSIAATAQE